MKKITLLACILFTGISFAQGKADATATTAAEIVEPIKIEKDRDLNFGRIIGGTAGGGTVTIDATDTGDRTIDSDLNAPGGTINSAKFTITASDNAYGIDLDATDLTATGLTTMPFNPAPSITDATTTGDQTLYVGGALTVGVDQEAGTYGGTVKVTVTYE